MLFKEQQPAKALAPISLTDAGTTTLLKALQPEKASAPVSLTDSTCQRRDLRTQKHLPLYAISHIDDWQALVNDPGHMERVPQHVDTFSSLLWERNVINPRPWCGLRVLLLANSFGLKALGGSTEDPIDPEGCLATRVPFFVCDPQLFVLLEALSDFRRLDPVNSLLALGQTCLCCGILCAGSFVNVFASWTFRFWNLLLFKMPLARVTSVLALLPSSCTVFSVSGLPFLLRWLRIVLPLLPLLRLICWLPVLRSSQPNTSLKSALIFPISLRHFSMVCNSGSC